MRLATITCLLGLPACGLFPNALAPEINATGTLTVAGDDNFTTSVEGTGLERWPTPACMVRLWDTATNPANDAKYQLTIAVGPKKLDAYVTGAQAQGPGATPVVSGDFRLFEGSKHSERTYTVTGGTITVTRFDAERIAGTFDLTGERSCVERTPNICRSTAKGSFDAKNRDCFPPVGAM